jgi:hypothetical protein
MKQLSIALLAWAVATAATAQVAAQALIEINTPGIVLIGVDNTEEAPQRARSERVAPGEHVFNFAADGVVLTGLEEATRYAAYPMRFTVREGHTYVARLAAGYSESGRYPVLNVAEMILCIDERPQGAPREQATELVCKRGADFIAESG